jgi:isopenicillin-N epimerase
MFGKHLRPQYLLQDDAVFLNHGSFGATPQPVRMAQHRWHGVMEAQPDTFFREGIFPATRTSANRIGALTGTRGDNIVFVPNATEAASVIFDSMRFQPGDEIILLDVAYAAIRTAADRMAARTGAVVRFVPTSLQMTEAACEEGLRAMLSPRTKLVLLDHIVSPTAQLVPVARLTALAKAMGARVAIDGAHALGQLPLELDTLGADWYFANAHKWLHTPRACAMLYAAPQMQDITRPVCVSHFIKEPWPRCFDYVGTRDVSAYLCAADGADHAAALEAAGYSAHRDALMARADAMLRGLGAVKVTPHAPAIAAWAMPQVRAVQASDGMALMNTLWRAARIQIAAAPVSGRLLLRLSFPAYVDHGDIEALRAALATHGWPGRS